MGEVVFDPAKYRSLGNAAQGGKANPVSNSPATGTTGAVAATLPASAAKLTYITGFAVGRTAGAGATITVAGLLNGSLFFTQLSAPLVVIFDPPLPASALNTAITVTSAADGTGTGVNVAAWGFQV